MKLMKLIMKLIKKEKEIEELCDNLLRNRLQEIANSSISFI